MSVLTKRFKMFKFSNLFPCPTSFLPLLPSFETSFFSDIFSSLSLRCHSVVIFSPLIDTFVGFSSLTVLLDSKALENAMTWDHIETLSRWKSAQCEHGTSLGAARRAWHCCRLQWLYNLWQQTADSRQQTACCEGLWSRSAIWFSHEDFLMILSMWKDEKTLVGPWQFPELFGLLKLVI